jgi:hypothetical protein
MSSEGRTVCYFLLRINSHFSYKNTKHNNERLLYLYVRKTAYEPQLKLDCSSAAVLVQIIL